MPRVGHDKGIQRGEGRGGVRMRTRRVGAVFALLMVFLAVAGFAYAHWSETLTINGTVETGVLDVAWVVRLCWDLEPSEKDVSNITCWFDSVDPHKLWVKVENA